MNDWAQGEKSGRRVYARLVQAAKTKPVYILASHSHFFMSGIFGTPEKKASGDVLPGWIVGTGGAIRYALPPGAAQAKEARTNIYGYLVGTVCARGAAPGEIRFEFHETREADVPAATLSRFGAEAVHECFTRNTSVPSACNLRPADQPSPIDPTFRVRTLPSGMQSDRNFDNYTISELRLTSEIGKNDKCISKLLLAY